MSSIGHVGYIVGRQKVACGRGKVSNAGEGGTPDVGVQPQWLHGRLLR